MFVSYHWILLDKLLRIMQRKQKTYTFDKPALNSIKIYTWYEKMLNHYEKIGN